MYRAKLVKGSSINEQTLRNAMKKGTRDCLEECQSFNLDFFMSATPDDEVIMPERHKSSLRFDETVKVAEISEDDFSDEEDLTHDDFFDPEEEDDSVTVNTSLGKISRKRAERIFLNGGGLKIAAKSRTTRFKNKRSKFDENSFKEYQKTKLCCSEAIVKGQSVRLYRFKDSKAVTGAVSFMSRNYVPMRSVCRVHNPDSTVWVFDNVNKLYVRCVLNNE